MNESNSYEPYVFDDFHHFHTGHTVFFKSLKIF